VIAAAVIYSSSKGSRPNQYASRWSWEKTIERNGYTVHFYESEGEDDKPDFVLITVWVDKSSFTTARFYQKTIILNLPVGVTVKWKKEGLDDSIDGR
jgi:hypothetical protein